METIRVITHSGITTEIEVETYDPVMMNENLNNHEINTVLIGDVIFSRIDVKLIEPIEAPNE
ncbi:hypothetical protein [Bacillus sp. AFS017336]|uniref:hypothetical protein n=1 Tax=Bacillus sp. AFS017336 TaxID=2033489 RepID=UPI000BF16301|nr:hypothetical protein [Bacillus sp. AFS017336]PEL13795.1 hypothetical protein CN601_03525 [Bacillus sp. AFS017336]